MGACQAMRHNGVMGIVAVASCAAVITSTMVGPVARLRHGGDRIFGGHNKRIAQEVGAGFIGGEAESVESFAVLGSAQAQLLLADMVEKADAPTNPSDDSFAPPPGAPFHFTPFSAGGPSGGPAGSGAAPAAAPPPPPSPPSPSPPPSPFSTAAAPAIGGFVASPPPPTPPSNNPTPSPPAPTPPTPNPPTLDNPTPPIPTPPDPTPPVTPPPIVAPLVQVSPPPAPFQRAADVPTPPAAAIPEPATWMMMILGFGGVGAALRQRRRHRRPVTGVGDRMT